MNQCVKIRNMSRRSIQFTNGYYYHVLNRGVEQRDIFLDEAHYLRFLELLRFYQRDHGKRFSLLSSRQREDLIASQTGNLLVEVICYSLMPNHFHLFLQQVQDGGISKYMRQVSDGYSRYFNVMHHRSGHLFQGNFRAVAVESDEQAVHLSRYIHLNGTVAGLAESPDQSLWSSYQEYLSKKLGLCNKQIILSQFASVADYRNFTVDYIDFSRKLASMKHLLLDESIG